MKRLLLILISLIAIASFVLTEAKPTEAYWVNGYYKSNGTYVQGHYRSRPNAYTYDNYSYSGPSYSNGYGYNDSYYYSSYDYSSDWYTPSWYDWDYSYGWDW